MNQHQPWSEKDLKRLKKLYPRYHGEWERLLKAFQGRTKRAISRAANKHGIKRLPRPKPCVCEEIKKLKKMRQELRVSQFKLAEKSGYLPHEISYWEQGKRQPDAFQIQCYRDSLERLAG